MSVYIPSGYTDRSVDYHDLVTFYIRDSLKSRAVDAFVKAAPSVHVYNAHTHEHWFPVGTPGQDILVSPDNIAALETVLQKCGPGSMVVVARDSNDTQAAQEQEEGLAQYLMHKKLIDSPEQFLVVSSKPAQQAQLQSGAKLNRLQLG